MLVVIVILGVLVGVTIGGIFGYVREAKRNKVVYIANQLETALNIRLLSVTDNSLISYIKSESSVNSCIYCGRNYNCWFFNILGNDNFSNSTSVSWDKVFEDDKLDIPDSIKFIFKDVFNEVLPDGFIEDIEDYEYHIAWGIDKNNYIRCKIWAYSISEIYSFGQWYDYNYEDNWLCKYVCSYCESYFPVD